MYLIYMDKQDIQDKDFYSVFVIILSILYIHVNMFYVYESV